jgi:hypothetical protein
MMMAGKVNVQLTFLEGQKYLPVFKSSASEILVTELSKNKNSPNKLR